MIDPNTLADALALAKKPVETACKLVENLLGEPCKVAGGMLADQVYAWQWTNRIRILNRAREIIEENDLAAKVLPPGFLLPLLQAAGDVEEPDLEEMWAQLLVSAVRDEEDQHPMFIDTLRRMNGEDSRLLRRLAEGRHPNGFPEDEVPKSLPRLVALGLIEQKFVHRGQAVAFADWTGFGGQFARAVGAVKGRET